MKIVILFLLLIVSVSNLNAQKIATKKIKSDPFHLTDNFILVQDGQKSFIISKYKTTNKEYLCFLMWTFRVYGLDYPNVYNEMLPDTTTYPDIFNPEKSNMPVKGINKKQAQAFCQWRSDRLNESILIREGILRKDLNQFNESSFNTESYLSNNYEGLVKNDLYDKYTKGVRKVLHSDFFLLPVFYIASKEQLRICNSLIKSTEIKRNKEVISDIDWWFLNELEYLFFVNSNKSPFDSYLTKLTSAKLSNNNEIKTFIKKYQNELATKTIEFDTINLMFSEKDYRIFNLHKYMSQLRYYKIIADSIANPFLRTTLVFEVVDSLGKMNYMYIADNYDASPILIYKTVLEEDNEASKTYSGFYCAMNIPYRIYWKLQEFHFIKNPNTKLYLW